MKNDKDMTKVNMAFGEHFAYVPKQDLCRVNTTARIPCERHVTNVTFVTDICHRGLVGLGLWPNLTTYSP
jgi:hypothetical protein